MVLRSTVVAALFTCLAAAQQPPETARFDGKIVDSAGVPLEKVAVSLSIYGATVPGRSPMIPANAAAAATNSEGRFLFDSLKPGTYLLSAEKNGFLRQSGAPMTFYGGEQMKDIRLTMTRYGVISGRVLDEDGEIYQVPSMTLFRKTETAAGTTVAEVTEGQGRATGGEFRYSGLAPGVYYLAVFPRTEPRTSSKKDEITEAPLRTFYPSATDVAAAAPIRVFEGSDLSGLDIKLVTGPTVRLRGRVVGTDIQDRQTELPQIDLAPKDFPLRGQSTGVAQDGSFEFAGISPGEYTLSALLFNTVTSVGANGQAIHGPYFYGRQDITVGDRNLTDIVLAPSPPFKLSGKVVGESQAVVGRRIILNSNHGNPIIDQVKSDGGFVLSGPIDATFELKVPVPPGIYIESVRLGEQDVRSEVLDFSQGPPAGPLVVTLKKSPGEIDGAVVTKDLSVVPGAIVTLVPDSLPAPKWVYRRIRADQFGQFILKDVAPGKYHLYAWEKIEDGAEYDVEFLKASGGDGSAVTVGENSSQAATVTLIPVQ